MPRLIVKLKDGEKQIQFNPGPSLRQILEANNLLIRAECRGNGACGLCQIRIEAGKVNVPTTNEYINLHEPELTQGIRLACQVIPEHHDLHVVLVQNLAD